MCRPTIRCSSSPLHVTESPRDAVSNHAAEGRPPAVPVRIYVNHISTLVTGAQLSGPRMKRHDAVVMAALGRHGFQIVADGFDAPVQAAVIAPNAAYAADAQGGQLIRIAIHIIHPRFPSLRALFKQAVTPLPREALSCFDDRLERASCGTLSADQAAHLMEEMIDLLLAGEPPAPAMDPRITWALKRLEADINHPFDDLAGELGISFSRLSHLFTEHLGISLRGCQAWGRMAMAWELLTHQRPDLSLTEVAHAMKFSDSSHLSRAFKRRYGMTPKMFRDPRMVQIIRPPDSLSARVPG